MSLKGIDEYCVSFCYVRLKVQSIEERGKNITASTFGKNMEIQIPSVLSSQVKKIACTVIFYCLSNNICVEKTDHKYATRNNQDSVKLSKVKLQTGRKGSYLLAAKTLNGLSPNLEA